jgi:hypothetical protein
MMARMAQPAAHELSVQEARARLVPLARMAGLTGQVTVLTDGGREIAALVPATMLGQLPAAIPAQRAAEAKQRAAAEGWERRLTTLREQLLAQHQGRTRELRSALAQVWAALDELSPPGRDRALDQLRAAHHPLVSGE